MMGDDVSYCVLNGDKTPTKVALFLGDDMGVKELLCDNKTPLGGNSVNWELDGNHSY